MTRHQRNVRLAQAALYLTILIVWEALPRAGVIPRLFVPPLSEALGALVQDHRAFLGSLPTTLGEIVAAYAIACGGGILAGQLVAASPAARRMLLPVVRGAYAVPLVVLYPVMMVWFGLGPESKIA
jgi:NitT/TauT family transport system permease protein